MVDLIKASGQVVTLEVGTVAEPQSEPDPIRRKESSYMLPTKIDVQDDDDEFPEPPPVQPLKPVSSTC